jgi:hypothetical protein
MQVGDLVKILDVPEVRKNNQDVKHDSVGVIIKYVDTGPLPLACAWVQWNGNADWDCMYVEDLEVISPTHTAIGDN